jgi:hypothetical protein
MAPLGLFKRCAALGFNLPTCRRTERCPWKSLLLFRQRRTTNDGPDRWQNSPKSGKIDVSQINF